MITKSSLNMNCDQRIARPFSNWARSYHDRLSKKWATILSRSFSQKVSQIRSWNFTIWSGSFPIIFKEYQKEQFRIYLNKAQNLEKHFIFFEKIYITFRFYKKDLNLSLWYIVIIYLLLSIFQIRSLIISYFFNCEIV